MGRSCNLSDCLALVQFAVVFGCKPHLSSFSDTCHLSPAASWLKVGGKKLRFSYRQVQISDKADTCIRSFNFDRKFSQLGFFGI